MNNRPVYDDFDCMELSGMRFVRLKGHHWWCGFAWFCWAALASLASGQSMTSDMNVRNPEGERWLWTPSVVETATRFPTATAPPIAPPRYFYPLPHPYPPAPPQRIAAVPSIRRLPAVQDERQEVSGQEATRQNGSEEEKSESSDSESDKKDEDGEAGEDKPIGEAPEDISEIFLRQSTVLLKPGEGQVDWGLLYTWQESQQTVVLNNGELTTEFARDRQLVVPLNIRYGIEERTQLFAQLPVGLAIFERADLQQDEVTSRMGTGDLVVGFKRLLCEAKDDSADVIGSLSVGAPIGNHSFHLLDSAAIGSGFWTLSGGLNFVKNYDPIVLYTGLGYTHFYEADHLGQSLQPGELFNYSFGMGFAVNDSIVLSSEMIGALQTYFYADGRRLPNSLTEFYSLRFALTQVLCKDRFLEPYVILGLNSDAPDLQVGIFHTFGF